MSAAMMESFAEHDAVRAQTQPDVLQKIDEQMEERIRFYASQPPEVISHRIEELDQEWDIERYLELNASSIALGSLVLGLSVSRKWLVLTGTVLGFLMMHSIQGWCPPIPLFRKMGIRTRNEIDREKFALKILRGDLETLPQKTEQLRQNPAQDIFRMVSS